MSSYSPAFWTGVFRNTFTHIDKLKIIEEKKVVNIVTWNIEKKFKKLVRFSWNVNFGKQYIAITSKWTVLCLMLS